MTGFPVSDTAGATNSITVTAYDPYGNVATGYLGTVGFTSSDGKASLPSSYTFAGSDLGTHTFPVTLDTSGTQSITATDQGTSSITGSESGIVVAAGGASSLKVTGFPVSDTAGATNSITVTAYDPYGNVASGFTGSIGFSSSDANAVLPAPYAFTEADAGTHTFAVTLEAAGLQSITATDLSTSSIVGTEAGITIHGVPLITWSPPVSIVYGTPLSATQLDATTSVPGIFTYSPAAGTILNAGSGQVISVTFTPQDTTYYSTASTTTTLTVTKASPILKVTDSGGEFDGTPFPASVKIAGAVSGVDNTPAASLGNLNPTLSYFEGSSNSGVNLGSTPPTAAGTYSVIASFPGNADYSAVQTTPITFSISRANTQVVLVPQLVYKKKKVVSIGLKAEIEPVTPGGSLPTGEMTFELVKISKKKTKVTTLGTVSVSGGDAILTVKAKQVVHKTIKIIYSGDTNYEADTVTPSPVN